MAIRLTESRLRQIIREEVSNLSRSRTLREGVREDAAEWYREKGLSQSGRVKMPTVASTSPVIKKLEMLFGTEGLYNAAMDAQFTAEMEGRAGEFFMDFPEAAAILKGLKGEPFWIRVVDQMEANKASGRIVPPSPEFMSKYPGLAGDYAESGYV